MQMQLLRLHTIVTIILLIYISRCDSQNTNVSSNDTYKHVDEYEKKICNNEPSCHLINQVPKEWTVLPVRNCMCDEDCEKYRDCCEDSIYYNKTRQLESSIFQCHPDEKVYMILTCPPDYPFLSIRSKCESSAGPLRGPNKKIFIPVTNKNKITYGNEYCAICNNDYSYEPWNLTAGCSQVFEDNVKMTSTTTSAGPFIDHYNIDLNEAKKRIEYDAVSKSFVSSYNDKKYNCWYSRDRPTRIIPYLRSCVPAVSSCKDTNDKLQQLCLSYTAYVQDEDRKTFRNVHCAQCNQVSKNLLALCNQPATLDHKISGSSLFSTNDKASG